MKKSNSVSAMNTKIYWAEHLTIHGYGQIFVLICGAGWSCQHVCWSAITMQLIVWVHLFLSAHCSLIWNLIGKMVNLMLCASWEASEVSFIANTFLNNCSIRQDMVIANCSVSKKELALLSESDVDFWHTNRYLNTCRVQKIHTSFIFYKLNTLPPENVFFLEQHNREF